MPKKVETPRHRRRLSKLLLACGQKSSSFFQQQGSMVSFRRRARAVILSEAKNEFEERSDENSWHLYIIECRTGELYVGICKNVAQRVRLHNTGRATRYTRYRIPVELIYSEFCGDYANARKRERIVKKFSREKKMVLAEKRKTSHP